MQQEEANVQKYTFQFHYGAIKTHPITVFSVPSSCFNSNMVRLRLECAGKVNAQNAKVSIPIWCD